MNLIFALLTIFFCLTSIGLKHQVDFGQTTDSVVQEADSDERFNLPLIPLIHNFIFLPTTSFVSTHIVHIFFAFNFQQEIISEVSSTGPPVV